MCVCVKRIRYEIACKCRNGKKHNQTKPLSINYPVYKVNCLFNFNAELKKLKFIIPPGIRTLPSCSANFNNFSDLIIPILLGL